MQLITFRINRNKVDKSAIYKGKAGEYLNGSLVENRDGTDQYGNDGFIVQDIGKDRRQAGEKGPIIGNWRRVEKKQGNVPAKAASSTPPGEEDDCPF